MTNKGRLLCHIAYEYEMAINMTFALRPCARSRSSGYQLYTLP